jgi:cell division protein FtsZ
MSRFVSYLLRHDPEAEGLSMDERGEIARRQLLRGALGFSVVFSALGISPCTALPLPSSKHRRVSVIGVGGAGLRIVNALKVSDGGVPLRTIGVDADQRLLAATPVDTRLLLDLDAPTFYDGGHAGINAAAALRQIESLRRGVEGTEVGVLVAGLGGGTGGGASPVIAGTLKEAGARVVAVVTLPFSFEGKRRQHRAEIALRTLSPEVDEMVVHQNDLAAFRHSPQIRVGNIWPMTDALIGGLVIQIAAASTAA